MPLAQADEHLCRGKEGGVEGGREGRRGESLGVSVPTLLGCTRPPSIPPSLPPSLPASLLTQKAFHGGIVQAADQVANHNGEDPLLAAPV